jgi:polysaccharide export outer membrane protein
MGGPIPYRAGCTSFFDREGETEGVIMKSLSRFCILVLSLTSFAWSQSSATLKTRPMYEIHLGDVIALEYRYTPEYNEQVTVQPDGYVYLQTCGQVKVAGLTVEQAKQAITEKASSRLKDPEINLTLKQFQTPYIVVAGQVEKPGRYELREETTALQAVLEAGGMDKDARSSQVLVFRKINGDEAEVKVLDLHSIHSTKDLEHDTVLQSGDMLLVPRNRFSKFERVVKLSNLGAYFPIP